MAKPRGRPFTAGNKAGRGRPLGSRNKSTVLGRRTHRATPRGRPAKVFSDGPAGRFHGHAIVRRTDVAIQQRIADWAEDCPYQHDS